MLQTEVRMLFPRQHTLITFRHRLTIVQGPTTSVSHSTSLPKAYVHHITYVHVQVQFSAMWSAMHRPGNEASFIGVYIRRGVQRCFNWMAGIHTYLLYHACVYAVVGVVSEIAAAGFTVIE